MDRPRATRLDHSTRTGRGFLGRQLPHGSLKRKIILGGVLPILLLALAGIVTDKIIMPTVTRHGSEFPLPDFEGQRLMDVRTTLDDLELEYEIASEEYSPVVPHGTVLNQYPVAGSRVKPGRAVKLVISMGQKQVIIPGVAGMSVRQAMLELESVGLKTGEIAWALADTIPEKVVVFSYPNAGIEIPHGSYVNLMVNHGRASNFTYMPNVVGMTIDEAIKKLEDKSLKVGIRTYRTDENYLPETVLAQSEPHGTELDVSTEIDLVVSSTE